MPMKIAEHNTLKKMMLSKTLKDSRPNKGMLLVKLEAENVWPYGQLGL